VCTCACGHDFRVSDGTICEVQLSGKSSADAATQHIRILYALGSVYITLRSHSEAPQALTMLAHLLLSLGLLFVGFANAATPEKAYKWKNVKIGGGGGFSPGIVFNPSAKVFQYSPRLSIAISEPSKNCTGSSISANRYWWSVQAKQR